MKKILLIILMAYLILPLTSCDTTKLKVIVPTGTPTLGLAYALSDKENLDTEIVFGSDPLVAALSSNTYDIVCAPINLGVKLYNTNPNFNYVLFKTIVWGNFYLASTQPIEEFSDLSGKKVVAFSKNSPNDVLLRSLINHEKKQDVSFNIDIEYVDDVSTANTYLMSGVAEIIVSAEPSLTKLKGNKNIYTFDLQAAWEKFTDNYAFPQAGIYVRKDLTNDKKVNDTLASMLESINLLDTNPLLVVESAIQIDESMNKLGKDILLKALPNCHFMTSDSEKEAIEFYLEQVISLDLGKTIGEKFPDEEFYYQK